MRGDLAHVGPLRTCTALDAPGSRCGRAYVVRDFTSSYYPDGPAIRLCGAHVRRFHAAALSAIKSGDDSAFERLCDSWRWAPDCVRV
jgi:hypothetical protein